MPLPGSEEIQRSLGASWRLMQGKADAERQLDLSADGFWNSFFGFVVAIPPLFVFWTREAIELAPGPLGERIGLVLRLAVIEVVAWIGPLLLVAWVLYRLGQVDRVAAFVVANNWGQAVVAWIILPAILLSGFAPQDSGFTALLLLAVLVVTLVLSWRLNNAVLNMGGLAPTLVVTTFVASTLAVDYVLRGLFGISPLAG